MTKKYTSRLNNLVVEGITFQGEARLGGSYHITTKESEQKRLEASPYYGRLYRMEVLDTAVPKAAEKSQPKVEVERSNVFTTSSLQEARQIIAEEREKRGMEAKGLTNKQSVLNAAKELGLRFPNIKTK